MFLLASMKPNKGFCDILQQAGSPMPHWNLFFSFHGFIKKYIMNEAGFNFQLKEYLLLCLPTACSFCFLHSSCAGPVQPPYVPSLFSRPFQTAASVSCHHVSNMEFSGFKRDFTSHLRWLCHYVKIFKTVEVGKKKWSKERTASPLPFSFLPGELAEELANAVWEVQ